MAGFWHVPVLRKLRFLHRRARPETECRRGDARHRGGHFTTGTATMRLNNKIALITGASAGIGRASALRFAAEGAKLVLNARRPEPLQALAEQIRAAGGEVVVHAADVADPGTAHALVDLAQQSFGGLDIALNNAGMLGRACRQRSSRWTPGAR
jgi:hypothetical protein